MPDKVRIALDAMGGDHGASVILPGADLPLTPDPDVACALSRGRPVVPRSRERFPGLKAKPRVIHAEVPIGMNAKPSQALRYRRWTSSMWLASDAVKTGEANAAVSAGNTGALM